MGSARDRRPEARPFPCSSATSDGTHAGAEECGAHDGGVIGDGKSLSGLHADEGSSSGSGDPAREDGAESANMSAGHTSGAYAGGVRSAS